MPWKRAHQICRSTPTIDYQAAQEPGHD